jgi:hypothetical protein
MKRGEDPALVISSTRLTHALVLAAHCSCSCGCEAEMPLICGLCREELHA